MRIHTPMISWHTVGTLNEPVMCIDIHPTGRIATGGADNALRIWQLNATDDKIELNCVAELERHTKTVNCVRFSPDGSCLASASDDGHIILWIFAPNSEKDTLEIGETESKNVENWKMRTSLTHGSDIYDICWSFDGTKLLSGSVDNKIMIWNISEGNNSCKLCQGLDEHSNFVQGVAFDPLMSFIASQSSDRTCRIFQLALTGRTKGMFSQKFVLRNRKRYDEAGVDETENCSSSSPSSPSSSSSSSSSSSDSSSFTSIEEKENETEGSKQHIMYYDELTVPSFVRRLCFSPDGSLLVSPAGRFRELTDTSSTKPTPTTYLFVRNQLSRPALQLPCASASVAVRFSPVFYTLREPKESLGLGLTYRMIFAVATSNSVMIYDTEQVNPIALANNIHFAAITDLSWSSNGLLLAVASTDGYCTFIVFAEGELGQPLPATELALLQEKMAEERLRVRTKLTTSATKPKRKPGDGNSDTPKGSPESGNIKEKKPKVKKEVAVKPHPSIDRWVKPQQSPGELKLSEVFSSPLASSSSTNMQYSPIARPNFEGSPCKVKPEESANKPPGSPLPTTEPPRRPVSPSPQPNAETAVLKPNGVMIKLSPAKTPNSKNKTVKKDMAVGCRRLDAWAKQVLPDPLLGTSATLGTQDGTSTAEVTPSSSEVRYCICLQSRDGMLIECSGPKETCPGRNWFHPVCVGIKSDSKAQETATKLPQWYCGQCTILRAGVLNPEAKGTQSPTKNKSPQKLPAEENKSPQKRPADNVKPTRSPKKPTRVTLVPTPNPEIPQGRDSNPSHASATTSTSVAEVLASGSSTVSTNVSFSNPSTTEVSIPTISFVSSSTSLSFGTEPPKAATNVTRLVPRSKRTISTSATVDTTTPTPTDSTSTAPIPSSS